MDREKVINGLQNLRDAIATDFIHEADQAVGTIDDALALLKEQEHKDRMYHALEDDWKRLNELLKEQENASKRNPVIVCPHCGKRVK